jgi:hypothetical protein
MLLASGSDYRRAVWPGRRPRVGLNGRVMEIEAAGIKHRRVGVVRVLGLELGDVAVVVHVAHREIGTARRPVPDERQAPVPDEAVHEGVGVTGPSPAAAEWQLPDAIDDQTMRKMRVVEALLVVGVGIVQALQPRLSAGHELHLARLQRKGHTLLNARDKYFHDPDCLSACAASSGRTSLMNTPIADSDPARYFSLPGARRTLNSCKCKYERSRST